MDGSIDQLPIYFKILISNNERTFSKVTIKEEQRNAVSSNEKVYGSDKVWVSLQNIYLDPN